MMTLTKTIIAAAAAMGLSASAYAAGETVVVAGATGKSGVPLIKILGEQGYKVRAMVRDKAKAGDLGAGVEVVQADVTKPETLGAAMKGATYVISTIGAGSPEPPNNPENVDYKGVANLTDAAKSAGVKHFVLMSSIGAGDKNPETFLNKRFGMVLMWKGVGEDHLRKSGLSYTIVRPGGLADCDPGKVGLKIAAGGGITGQGRICRSDVGLIMADALTNKDAAGKTIDTVSDDKAAVTAWKSGWAGVKKD
jgi:uncharacterized protein YbjT (DUF2867 family)